MGKSTENLLLPIERFQMSFRFSKRIQIAPGLAITFSKGWPSLSIGGQGAILNLGPRGPRTTLEIPRTGMSWQFSADRHIHKAVQVQADVKAVHAQGTVRAVQAQAEIIAITKRMETVAKRLTRNAAGSTYWKKAAIEQAQLLDAMLDVAKASENDQLIAAVQKCHHAWGDGNPHFRAALDSGMTITKCLATVLAGRQPALNISENLSNHPVTITNPVTTTNKVKEPALNSWLSDQCQLVLEKRDGETLIDQPTFRLAFWKTVGRNLILPVTGCVVIAVVSTIAVRKSPSRPGVIVSATPMPEVRMATSTPPRPAVMPVPELGATTPGPQLATPTPSTVQSTPTPSQHEQLGQTKAVRHKHPTHNSFRLHPNIS